MKNQQIGNSGKGTHTWLSGLLKCADCGYSLKVLKDKAKRYLVCSGRYNLSKCDAVIRADLLELEVIVQTQIEKLMDECPVDKVEMKQDDTWAKELEELERRADRLMDAFAESGDMPATYLQRALARLEKERQVLQENRKREQSKPVFPERLIFSKLSFEEKKLVAAQFVRRIDVGEKSAEICWNI